MAEDTQKVEYADFSDMIETPLPETIEENQAKNNINIQYIEDEVQAEPEPAPEVKVEKENPDSYKYWQSQADKRDRELREEREKRERLEREFESIKSQINPPKKEEPLVVPQRPPKPTSDDPLDLIKYNQDLAEYLNQTIEYNNKLNQQRFSKQDAYFQQLEAERQQRIQQEEILRQRAYHTSQLTVHGNLSPEEATQALAEFAKDADNPEQYYKDLADFYRSRHGQSKTSKVEQRATRPQALPPLGTMPSQVETQKADPSDEYYNDMQGFIKRNY